VIAMPPVPAAFPLIAGYVYHKGSWHGRKARNFSEIFSKSSTLKAEGYTEVKVAAH
jgi:hypothetical protein